MDYRIFAVLPTLDYNPCRRGRAWRVAGLEGCYTTGNLVYVQHSRLNMSLEFLHLINLLVLCLFSIKFLFDKTKHEIGVLDNPLDITYIEQKIIRYKNNVRECCLRTFMALSVCILFLCNSSLSSLLSPELTESMLTLIKYGLGIAFITIFAARSLFFFSKFNKADDLVHLWAKRYPHGELPKDSKKEYRYVKNQLLAEDVGMFFNIFSLLTLIGLFS